MVWILRLEVVTQFLKKILLLVLLRFNRYKINLFIFHGNLLNAGLAKRLKAVVVDVQDWRAHVYSEIVEVVEYLLILFEQISKLLQVVVDVSLLGLLLELFQAKVNKYLLINIFVLSF